MSETTDDDRNDAAPISDRPEDADAATARPLGFLGLGGMGMAVAIGLASRFPLLGCDQDPARLSLLVDKVDGDGRVHTTPIVAELVERCGVIAVLQPSAADAHRMIAELAAGARTGTMLLDLSSAHPNVTRRFAAELSDRSVHLLDVPVLGTEEGAQSRTLTILAGGAEVVLVEALPYLEPLGTVVRAGPIGTGHTLAALLGAVAAAGPEAAGEARSVAERSGIEPGLFNNLMAAEAARPSVDGLSITVSLAESLDLPAPLITAALQACLQNSGRMPLS